jgi:hypothetical protein
MKKFVIALVLLWPLITVQQTLAAEKIGAVTGAGITCTGKLPDKISARFMRQAKRACEKRGTCTIRATYISGARKLARYGCTNFYVVAKCGAVNREFRSKAIRGKLRIAC